MMKKIDFRLNESFEIGIDSVRVRREVRQFLKKKLE